MSLSRFPEAGDSKNLPIYNVNLYDQVRESYSHYSVSFFYHDMTENQYHCPFRDGILCGEMREAFFLIRDCIRIL